MFIQYPDGQWQAEDIPTGRHCTNYRAEVQALIHAALVIGGSTDPDAQMVFLSDAKSAIEAALDNKFPPLTEALQAIKCTKIVIQWIPSHCGIYGNEQADKMAKLGTTDNQQENKVSLNEIKTIIKSLHRPPPTTDSYHQLSRQEQVVIFRLRTGHNRLNSHMHRRFHIASSPLCFCGEKEQTTEHILQRCKKLQQLRQEVWTTPTSLHDKLHGTVESLQKTTNFILRANLQV